MKRTAATFIFLAGLGGCASPSAYEDAARPFGQASTGKEVPGMIGPKGEPVHTTAAAQMPTDTAAKKGVIRADLRVTKDSKDSGVQQTAGFARVTGGDTGGSVRTGGGCADGNCAGGPGNPNPYGPMAHGAGLYAGHGGILPVPGMGPAGAVAAVGAIGSQGGMYAPMYANQRSSIRFANPQGMNITWQTGGGSFVEPAPLQAPARYNFAQGNTYRLRLSGIPNRPGKTYYPTLEVYPASPKTVTYLSHNTVPVAFTDEDFEQVNSGNLVIKVVYLPDPQFQDLAALAGAEEVVSTRLEPGVDPVAEANRRGTLLAVIRIGNIDLQDPNTPAMDAMPGMPVPGAFPVMPKMMPTPTGPSGGGGSTVPTPNLPSGGGSSTVPKTPAPLPNAVKSPSSIAVPTTPISLPK